MNTNLLDAKFARIGARLKVADCPSRRTRTAVPNFAVRGKLVFPNEPLVCGNGGKPHWVECCYRTGGEAVHVCSKHPNGVTEAQYGVILSGNPKAKRWGWRAMRRNPGVYVKGRVRHPEHATITLHGWHRVVLNTEGLSKAMKNVAFLD